MKARKIKTMNKEKIINDRAELVMEVRKTAALIQSLRPDEENHRKSLRARLAKLTENVNRIQEENKGCFLYKYAITETGQCVLY